MKDHDLHVAVDLDDVTLQFVTGVLSSFQLEFGVPTFGYDGHPWGHYMTDEFSHHEAFKAAGYDDWWGWLRDRDWLWATFPAVPGAIGGLKRLEQMGCYVELLTSKPDWARPQVNRWLGKWRPYYDRLTVVRPGESKLDYSEADIIIDDSPKTCDEWAVHRKAILFDQTGDSKSAVPTLRVASNWEQVLRCIQSTLDIKKELADAIAV